MTSWSSAMRMRRRMSELDAVSPSELLFADTTVTSDSSTGSATFAFFSGTLALTRVPSRPKSTTELAQTLAHTRNADAQRGNTFDLHASRARFDSLSVVDDFELHSFRRIVNADFGVRTAGITM